MKLYVLTSTLGLLAILLGTTWIGSQSARAIDFTPPPDNAAPREGSGGAARSGFQFTPPPDNNAPRQGAGGASRTTFTPPPDNSAPRQGAGGAARTDFIPPSENTAPRQGAGGAARTDFIPPSENTAPRQGAGGAARTDFIPPSDNTAPQQAAGGSSRTLSPSALYLGVQALVPQSYYGTTLKEHPTILIYLPASNAEEAVFSIKDENRNLLYQMVVPISGKAGVIALQLPDTAPSLEVGQNYQWYMALKLDGELTPRSPFVDGWIERVEPSPALVKALATENSLEVAEALGANGVWYDCVATLAALRSTQPADPILTGHWEELLGSVGLDNVVSAPLVLSRATGNFRD
ncbi:MAG: DUF928 domain-containing protein [Cyanobacteriota bacterium]|nr:DUF928 domain-containing protein [Cyanobacteriota bacterium]